MHLPGARTVLRPEACLRSVPVHVVICCAFGDGVLCPVVQTFRARPFGCLQFPFQYGGKTYDKCTDATAVYIATSELTM